MILSPHRPFLLALITGLLLLVPSLALGDVVVHDGGVNRDRSARQVVTARTGESPHLVLSSDVLAGPSRMLSANASVERCEGKPVDFDIRRKLGEITDRVLAFALDEALEGLRIVDTLLPCSSKPIDRRVLARFAFLEGAALLDQGDTSGATEAMARAATFNPEYKGERGFPGNHLSLLEERHQYVSALRPGRLFVWREPGMRAMFIDGVEVERIAERGISLKPGRHLLQVESPEGLQGMWLDSRGSESIIIFPGAGRAIWASAAQSPGGERGLRLLLSDEFHGREGNIHTIHYQGRRGLGATYPADGGPRISWKKRPKAADGRRVEKKESRSKKKKAKKTAEVPPQPAQANANPEETEASFDDLTTDSSDSDDASTPKQSIPRPAIAGTSPPKRFRIAVTGGFEYADPFEYGFIGLDLSVRLYKILEVNGFVRTSLGGVHSFPVPEGEDSIEGQVLFVPFGASVGIRKRGAFSPWVAVGGQIAWNRDGLSEGAYLGGVLLQGGVDWAPTDSFFFIRAQAEIGNLGLHLSTRFSGGIGFRL